MVSELARGIGNLLGDLVSVPLRLLSVAKNFAFSNPYTAALSVAGLTVGTGYAFLKKQDEPTNAGYWENIGTEGTTAELLGKYWGGLDLTYRDWVPSWLQFLGPLDKTPYYGGGDKSKQVYAAQTWREWYDKQWIPDFKGVPDWFEDTMNWFPRQAIKRGYGALYGWRY